MKKKFLASALAASMVGTMFASMPAFAEEESSSAAAEEVTASAEEVNATMHNLNQCTIELDEIAVALKESIDKFTLE